ncbi:hypothetical protein SEA_INCA_39 [Mycobacterium phage Inca]|uniref:Uncharacterized protein n=4 Tax=Kostyavirus toto TaxID=1993871 RepID=G1DHX7_9CAUD|nr:hypothetical protein SEA_TOTO_41 [Mycobacterium phage Toto]AGR48880.1 hypothetical protein PBI_ABCAT_40 [Mycobacterium phage ABCat]APC43986.1 hypothetical protein SEA_TUCO_43 [Mycobacterium phage Tuco]APU02863.1 hypothetical protein SEA_CRYSTALP_42 [Mycobacterium phage CrystalP]AXH47587.1 hypothetical protein SEA_IHOP_40 [Mycobacterium phage IHOP]AXH48219.1 hypothetical protein SEA_PHAJA_40 [Mycobacterium phage Phaja]AXH65714.1 hypothetical protein SEA_INCA_39 [Mycobacterium phage Inca]QG
MSSEAQNLMIEVIDAHTYNGAGRGFLGERRAEYCICGWSEEGDGVHTAHVAYEVDKALGGLTREEQWVPVEESGHRWLGRSEDEAAWALENYSKDGDSHDPDMDSPLTHIAHEARWVSGWSEAPREVERPHSAMSANDYECGDDCRNPEHYELKA